MRLPTADRRRIVTTRPPPGPGPMTPGGGLPEPTARPVPPGGRLISTASTAAGGGMTLGPLQRRASGSGANAVVLPQQPTGPPEPPPIAPTFGQPRPTTDPRIERLMRELEQQRSDAGSWEARLRGLDGPLNLPKLDLSGIDRQGAQLRGLLAQLMRGEGINIGDVSNDPEAVAYAVARRRAEEQEREAAAAAQGASGIPTSGDFQTEAAKIRESSGQDIAANRADVTGRRRAQALSSALSSAQLQMGELGRQAESRRAEHGAAFEAEMARREGLLASLGLERQGAESSAANKQRLLETLLGEGARRESVWMSERDRFDASNRRALEEELVRQDVEGGRRKLGGYRGSPFNYAPYGRGPYWQPPTGYDPSAPPRLGR